MAEGSHYDESRAMHAVNFIECLCHTKGTFAGKPFRLLDWQKTIIKDLFGTIKEDGNRQFNTAYIECAKKSGKTELAAAIALYMTCADGEINGEIYSAAADRHQASLTFDVAVSMVRMNRVLSSRMKILSSQKRMIYLPTNSVYQVLSADAYRHHGYNVSAVVIDELHVQKTDELFNVLTKGASDARAQPMRVYITTAGTDTRSICYQQHCKAKDILEGRKVDPEYYPVIYAADPEDDWTDPEVWKKANPSMGVTFPIEKMASACRQAQENPAEENIFRQLRLSQWVKQTVRWMPMEKWNACAFPVDEQELYGRVCYGGLDLSTTTDLTAFVLVFPPEESEGRYQVLSYFWVPEETMDQRVRRDNVPYDLWARQGYLMTTEGNVVHYGFIQRFIEELGERFNIKGICYDRWNAGMLIQNLQDAGFEMIPFGQGFASMSTPTKELMRMVLEEKIAHGGHPVLSWCMDNAVVRTDPAGNIKLDKSKATERIDGAVALVMALDRAIRCGAESGESVYENRGLLFV